MRRDSDIRLELLDRSLAGARTAEDVIDVLVRQLEDLVEHDPNFIALVFELFSAARR